MFGLPLINILKQMRSQYYLLGLSSQAPFWEDTGYSWNIVWRKEWSQERYSWRNWQTKMKWHSGWELWAWTFKMESYKSCMHQLLKTRTNIQTIEKLLRKVKILSEIPGLLKCRWQVLSIRWGSELSRRYNITIIRSFKSLNNLNSSIKKTAICLDQRYQCKLGLVYFHINLQEKVS